MSLQINHPVNADAIRAVTTEKPISQQDLVTFAQRYLGLTRAEIDNASGCMVLVNRDIVHQCLEKWCNRLPEDKRKVGELRKRLVACSESLNVDTLHARVCLSKKHTEDGKLTLEVLSDVAEQIGSIDTWADMFETEFSGTAPEITSQLPPKTADLLLAMSKGIWEKWVEKTDPTMSDMLHVLDKARREHGYVNEDTIQAVEKVLKKSEQKVHRVIECIKSKYNGEFCNLYPLPNTETDNTYNRYDYCIDLVLRTQHMRVEKHQASTEELRLDDLLDFTTKELQASRILIQGEPGSGKTYISTYIAKEWASERDSSKMKRVKDYAIVIHIDAENISEGESLVEHAMKSLHLSSVNITSEELERWLDALQQYICFIIDNYDEKLHASHTICKSLIAKSTYPKSHLVLFSGKGVSKPSVNFTSHLIIDQLRGADIKHFLNKANPNILNNLVDFNIKHRFLRSFISRPRHLWYFKILEEYKADVSCISLTKFFTTILLWQCEEYKQDKDDPCEVLGANAVECLCHDKMYYVSNEDINTFGIVVQNRKHNILRNMVTYTYTFRDEYIRAFLAAKWIVHQATTDINSYIREIDRVSDADRYELVPFVLGVLTQEDRQDIIHAILSRYAFPSDSIPTEDQPSSAAKERKDHFVLKCLSECIRAADEDDNDDDESSNDFRVDTGADKYLRDVLPTIESFDVGYATCRDSCYRGMKVVINHLAGDEITCVYNTKEYKHKEHKMTLLNNLQSQKTIAVNDNDDFDLLFENDTNLEKYCKLEQLKISRCSGLRTICTIKTQVLQIHDCDNSLLSCIYQAAQKKLKCSKTTLQSDVISAIFDRSSRISVTFHDIKLEVQKTLQVFNRLDEGDGGDLQEHVEIDRAAALQSEFIADVSFKYRATGQRGTFEKLTVKTSHCDHHTIQQFQEMFRNATLFDEIHLHCQSLGAAQQMDLLQKPQFINVTNWRSLTLVVNDGFCTRSFVQNLKLIQHSLYDFEVRDSSRTLLKYTLPPVANWDGKWLYLSLEAHGTDVESTTRDQTRSPADHETIWQQLLTHCMENSNLRGVTVLCHHSDVTRGYSKYNAVLKKKTRRNNPVTLRALEFIVKKNRKHETPAAMVQELGLPHIVQPSVEDPFNLYEVYRCTRNIDEGIMSTKKGAILDCVDL